MIPNENLSINEGTIIVPGWQSCNKEGSFTNSTLKALYKKYNFDLDTPFNKYPKKIRDILLNGTGDETFKIKYQSQWTNSKSTYEVSF